MYATKVYCRVFEDGMPHALIFGGGSMLRKCANSSCNRKFHYVQNGKAFRVESKLENATAEDGTCVTVEYYWLCDACLLLVLPLLTEHRDRNFYIPNLAMTRTVRMMRVDEAMAEGAVVAEALDLPAPALT
jgi:hypothetical protein